MDAESMSTEACSVATSSTEIYWRAGPSGQRSFLPGDWSQIRLYREAKLHDERECVEWCMRIGILPASMSCRRDRRPMSKRYREDREYCY